MSCGQNFVNGGSAGYLDGVTIVEGHEYAETLTDQNPMGGWWDSIGGGENADKCVWRTQEPGAARNVQFASGSFAMQSTWSNDGETCLIAHPIWGVPGLSTIFFLDAVPRFAYVAPGDVALTSIQATTITGDPQALTLTTSGEVPDATVTLSSSSIQSDEAATLTVETSPTTPDGYYPITVAAAGTGEETTFGVTVGPPPPPLQSGVPVLDLSGQAGSDRIYQFDVPLGYMLFDVTIGGGTGDADLYLRADAPPTDDSWDCKSSLPNGFDSCPVFTTTSSTARTWFVRVHAFSDYAGLSLYATYANPLRLLRRESRTDLSGLAGSQRFYWVYVPANRHHLSVSISRALGDADLHVRRSSLPDPVATECHKVRQGQHGETCKIKNPVGAYYIGIYGVTDYSRLTVKVSY